MKFKRISLACYTTVVIAMMAGCQMSAKTITSGNKSGRHSRVFVVPCQAAGIKVDGKLDDWDLSGQIEMSAGSQSAKFAMMYDAQALYISGEVSDATLLMNRHDPLVDPEAGGDADACQVCFHLDPKVALSGYSLPNDKITMNLWQYTDRKEPCLWIGSFPEVKSYDGFFTTVSESVPRQKWPKGVAPRDAYQAAYAITPDRMGYIFEYRIPWGTLGTKTVPQAGDIMACNVQFNWGTSDGMKKAMIGDSAVSAIDVTSASSLVFAPNKSGCWGRAVFCPKGNLPRKMVEAGIVPDTPLPLTFTYDLPRDAEVTIALVNNKGQYARHLVAQGYRQKGAVIESWDGLDDSGQPLPAGKYTWKGIFHDPITTRHLLSVNNSGKPPYSTEDGTGSWGSDHNNPATVCAAGDKMLLGWLANSEAGWGLLRTDLTGRRQWGIKDAGYDVVTDGGSIYVSMGNRIGVYSFTTGQTLKFGNGKTQIGMSTADTKKTELFAGRKIFDGDVTGLVLYQGVLYVSFAGKNMIGLYDAKQGTLRESWTVSAPGRLAIRPDGSLLVISQGKVVAARKDEMTPVVSDHLDSPVSLALDAVGNIYVANGGALQNVSVFTPKGEYVRSIGKPGGRPRMGLFDNTGMLEPGGIAIDKEGKLWVAETLDSPKRISVWKAADGTLLNEFFGAGHYATSAYMDPLNEDEVFCDNVLWKVNLDQGTWYPHSTLYRATKPNSAFQPGVLVGGSVCSEMQICVAKNGRQYLLVNTEKRTYMLYLREGDVMKPLLGVIDTEIMRRPNPWWIPVPLFDDSKKYPNGVYAWQDANDDQVMQDSEIVRYAKDKGEGVFKRVDSDLNLYCWMHGNKKWHDGNGSIFRPLRIEDDGRPVYDFTKPEKMAEGVCDGDMAVDPGDGSFFVLDVGPSSKGKGFFHYSRDGKLLWRYRKVVSWLDSYKSPALKSGEVWGVTRNLGLAGNFTGIATYYGPFTIFTKDGLFVAKCFKDQRQGKSGPDVIKVEAFAGQLVKLEKSGRYLFLGGESDGRVTEILGLDSIRRFEGKYELTAATVNHARQARDKFAEVQTKSQSLVIIRGNDASRAPAVLKVLDDKRAFTARAAYDKKNLYVNFEVNSPAELVNRSSDFQTVFKGGNCLDIQLASDPSANPERKAAAPGDVRILVTRQPDPAKTNAYKTLAVVYRPKLKDFQGKPIVFSTTGGGTESFDEIKISEDVKLADYSVNPVINVTGIALPGFNANVVIPLKVLGWSPEPATKARIDVGYLFGNATGNQITVRAYWANNSFAASMINDIPHESRLEPHEWGDALVE